MAVSTAEHNATVGSWFPSGFHGHFRSKSRNDFICEYRQLAKPQPPKKFNRRAQDMLRAENPGRHLFSRHDNRHSFLSDALYFEEGLGRKRLQSNNFATNKDLLTWRPTLEDLKRCGPSLSHYQVTYRQPTVPIKQLLVTRPKTSFDHDTSTYRYVHGKDNPNRDVINAMTNEALMSKYTKKPAFRSSQQGRESVATCLSWYEGPPRTPAPQQVDQDVFIKRGVPAATETYVHVPTPPSCPKPSAHTHIQQVAAASEPKSQPHTPPVPQSQPQTPPVSQPQTPPVQQPQPPPCSENGSNSE